jgi:hypothetical protein
LLIIVGTLFDFDNESLIDLSFLFLLLSVDDDDMNNLVIDSVDDDNDDVSSFYDSIIHLLLSICIVDRY